MSCEDIPSLLDLQNTKKHADDFGRLMGTGEGDSTNEVTGQVRPTYNKVMKSVGFKPGSGDFTTGFTVMPGERDIAWYDPVSSNWYSYLGIIPTEGHPVAPGTSPVGDSNWAPRTDELLRSELISEYGSSLVGGTQVTRLTVSSAKAKTSYNENEVVYLIDRGYNFQFKSSRQLIAGQSVSEMTFDDELHVLIDSGGMLEFCDWQKLPAVESKNYANYQAKLRGRSDSVGVCAIGDSTTFCQAQPLTIGATDRSGQPTGFGDGSTYANWQVNNHWPKVLGDIMQSAAAGGASVSNLGFSGDRALTGYLRHRVATSNDVTMIMFGINDVLYATSNGVNPDQIYDNGLYSLVNFQMVMRKLIARELVRGKTVVVVGTNVFGSVTGWDGTGYSANRLTEAYDTVSKSVAQEFGCLFVDNKSDIMRQYNIVDLTTFTTTQPTPIVVDGTHLNETGCKILGGRFAAVILSKWKTPTIVTSKSTLLSNPNVTDMIGKGQNGVLPNSSSNSPSFSSTQPATISLTAGQPVFYPIYVEEDSLIVFPEMIGSAAGAQVTFRVNGGAILPAKLNPRELGTTPAPSKAATVSGTHIDESTQNYSQDGMFIALVARGWHLLEVSKDSGSGGALLDSFQFYSEKEIRDKHTRGLTAVASAGNTRNWRASAVSNGGGLYTITFDQNMANALYHVEVDQSTNNDAQFYRVHTRANGNFKIQFMSGAGTGSGINFIKQDPLDFTVRVYGGR